jgi:hypothetical protein
VIRDLTLRGGSGTSAGGGLQIQQDGGPNPSVTTTLEDCVLEDNSAQSGGGIRLSTFDPSFGGGTATISRCAIRANTATGNGAGGVDSVGAGVVIRYSTLSDNESLGVGAGGIGAQGGGGSIVNSTISGNTGGSGGGIAVHDSLNGTNVSIRFTMITDNASDEGGGIWVDEFGIVTATVGASIVAGNTALGDGPDVLGPVTSSDDNLIGDGSDSSGFTGPGDQVGTSGSPLNPQIGALANNGGPTETHKPAIGNPVVNAADCVAGITDDQRALARPVGPKCDTGAVGLPELASRSGWEPALAC